MPSPDPSSQSTEIAASVEALASCPAQRGWMRSLMPGTGEAWPCHSIHRLFLVILLIWLIGTALLALPVAWDGYHPYEADLPLSQQKAYPLSTHVLNVGVMSMGALTGTGLPLLNVGHDFSLFGRWVLLAMMELGGLVWLTLSTAAGWRLRAAMGWGHADDEPSHAGMRRVVMVTLGLAVLLQAVGALVLRSATLNGTLLPEGLDGNDATSWAAAIFTSVSAFTNTGFLWRRGSLIGSDVGVWVYVTLGALMWLGALGGPVLYEIVSRLFHRAGAPRRGWSTFFKLTVLGSVGLVITGGLLVFIVESTRNAQWQLRYESEGRPGHLNTSSSGGSASESPTTASDALIGGGFDFGNGDEPLSLSEPPSRAERERLQTMSAGQRLGHALFLALQTGSGGMHGVRLDDASIAPASRWVLTGMMLIGGPLGGTSGGVRFVTLIVLAVALRRAIRSEIDGRELFRAKAVSACGVGLVNMLGLVAVVTFVLVYRRPDALERCLFDAVSVCSNVGLSTGLTAGLPLEDHTPGPLILRFLSRLTLIGGMLLGKLIPLFVMLRMVPASTSQPNGNHDGSAM